MIVLGAGSVLGQCPGSEPLPPEVAENDPVWAELCILPGGGCPVPDPPQQAIGWSAQPQQIVIQATVPSDYTATSAKWRVESLNASGLWETLYDHSSTQELGADGQYDPGEVVKFAAVGLPPGSDHRFRVAFCNDSGCLCWSARSATIPTQPKTDFIVEAPDPPLDPMIQDRFNRPATDPKCQPDMDNDGTPDGPLGDGLGPEVVWDDCSEEIYQHHSMVIAPNQESARATGPSRMMVYQAKVAEDSHSYAYAKVRVTNPNEDPSGFKYNLQIQARIAEDQSAAAIKSYAVKLIENVRGCTSPTLFVVRLPGEYDFAGCENGEPHSGLPADAATLCVDGPPLDEIDTNDPEGRSKPVHMQIEVRDIQSAGVMVPKIIGTVGWGNCPDDKGIEDCEFTCQVVRTDTDDPGGMVGINGRWGMGFHEMGYDVLIFEAGSDPATP